MTYYRAYSLLFVLLSSSANSLLRVDEINGVSYNVDILSDGYAALDQLWRSTADGDNAAAGADHKEPAGGSEAASEQISRSSSLTMTTKYGQKFNCEIPNLDTIFPTDSALGTVDVENITAENISQLLSNAFRESKCLKKTVGWWTYEVCDGESVRQFHLDNGKLTGDVISLGNFSHSEPAKRVQQRALDGGTASLFFNQSFVDGTLCNLNSRFRATEVRYFCDDELDSFDAYIDMVDEPETCQYRIDIRVGSLCKLTAFLPKDKPRAVQQLTCRPTFTQEQLEKYQAERNYEAAVEAAKKAAEEKLQQEQKDVLKSSGGETFSSADTPEMKGIEKAIIDKMVQRFSKQLKDSLTDALNSANSLNPDDFRIVNMDLKLPATQRKDLNKEATAEALASEDLVDDITKMLDEFYAKFDRLPKDLNTMTEQQIIEFIRSYENTKEDEETQILNRLSVGEALLERGLKVERLLEALHTAKLPVEHYISNSELFGADAQNWLKRQVATTNDKESKDTEEAELVDRKPPPSQLFSTKAKTRTELRFELKLRVEEWLKNLFGADWQQRQRLKSLTTTQLHQLLQTGRHPMEWRTLSAELVEVGVHLRQLYDTFDRFKLDYSDYSPKPADWDETGAGATISDLRRVEQHYFETKMDAQQDMLEGDEVKVGTKPIVAGEDATLESPKAGEDATLKQVLWAKAKGLADATEEHVDSTLNRLAELTSLSKEKAEKKMNDYWQEQAGKQNHRFEQLPKDLNSMTSADIYRFLQRRPVAEDARWTTAELLRRGMPLQRIYDMMDEYQLEYELWSPLPDDWVYDDRDDYWNEYMELLGDVFVPKTDTKAHGAQVSNTDDASAEVDIAELLKSAQLKATSLKHQQSVVELTRLADLLIPVNDGKSEQEIKESEFASKRMRRFIVSTARGILDGRNNPVIERMAELSNGAVTMTKKRLGDYSKQQAGKTDLRFGKLPKNVNSMTDEDIFEFLEDRPANEDARWTTGELLRRGIDLERLYDIFDQHQLEYGQWSPLFEDWDWDNAEDYEEYSRLMRMALSGSTDISSSEPKAVDVETSQPSASDSTAPTADHAQSQKAPIQPEPKPVVSDPTLPVETEDVHKTPTMQSQDNNAKEKPDAIIRLQIADILKRMEELTKDPSADKTLQDWFVRTNFDDIEEADLETLVSMLETLEEGEEKIKTLSKRLESKKLITRITKQLLDQQAANEDVPAESGRIQINRKSDYSNPVKVSVSTLTTEGENEDETSHVVRRTLSQQTQRLEQQLNNKLKNVQFDSKEKDKLKHVQVKVITGGYFNSKHDQVHVLSDAESSKFTDMVVELLRSQNSKDTEVSREEKRQKQLEKSYSLNAGVKSSPKKSDSEDTLETLTKVV